uniref:Uncharacterized protein n=1 Tax=Oryza nivara TaxID=4536 RepID=A0A0E0I676_ORYNI
MDGWIIPSLFVNGGSITLLRREIERERQAGRTGHLATFASASSFASVSTSPLPLPLLPPPGA